MSLGGSGGHGTRIYQSPARLTSKPSMSELTRAILCRLPHICTLHIAQEGTLTASHFQPYRWTVRHRELDVEMSSGGLKIGGRQTDLGD